MTETIINAEGHYVVHIYAIYAIYALIQALISVL